MRAGQASITAQRVAAHRLTFEREPAPYGDPGADEALARDVAAGVTVDARAPMSRYLAGRTRFFDRVVVSALDRGVTQVVVAAAGYDGRALRYAKPGVRWFELDHPDTQRDKREHLTRLGLDTNGITFVAADFTHDDVTAELRAAGLDGDVPTLVLCEGVAVYLERDVLTALLGALRTVVANGSRLAISLSVAGDDDRLAARRARFQAAVASVGEPARTVMNAEESTALLAATGWQPAPAAGEGQERARAAGFVLALAT